MELDVDNKHYAHGQGRWHVDPTAQLTSGGGLGAGVEDFHFEYHSESPQDSFRAFYLERYDLHRDYKITSQNASDCESFNTTGSMPNPWAWVEQAHYDGRRGHGRHLVDVWNATYSDPKRGSMEVAVAVLAHDITRPTFFGRRLQNLHGQFEKTLIEFQYWDTTKPASSEFQVPQECGAAFKQAATLLKEMKKKSSK